MAWGKFEIFWVDSTSGWLTQSGLWAAVEKKNNAKNIEFWAEFWQKLSKNIQNIKTSLNFKTSLGRRNFILDRGLSSSC
jgi:hypothetical protein